MAQPTSGLKTYIHNIEMNANNFYLLCNDIVKECKDRKYSQADAKEVYEKVERAFKDIQTNIELANPFLVDGSVLKEGAEEHFNRNTITDKRVRDYFNKAINSLKEIEP